MQTSSKRDSIIKNQKNLTPSEVVKREYSNPRTIRDCYYTVGLWKSEEMLVDKYFNPKGSVLDIGCGAGRATIALARKGYRTIGIDVVSEMLEAAKEQAQKHGIDISLVMMNALDYGFKPESFDHILFSFNGFEHIGGASERLNFLKNTYSMLKPGGCFIFSIRSGFAIGKRWFAWFWMAMRNGILHPLGMGNSSLKWGDMVFGGSYHHYHSPFTLRKDIRSTGFVMEYFNSQKNIMKHKSPNVLTNFSNDLSLFFVLRKPGL